MSGFGRFLNGRAALLVSLAVTAAPSQALATCSGLAGDNIVCDAANPSGGSLDAFTVLPGATVDINAGAGINTGVALKGAAYVKVGGDLIFTLTDPAGISSTVSNSNAIMLDGFFDAQKITYNGSSNVTSAATGIRVVPGFGGTAITQSAGVVTGVGNAIEVSADVQRLIGDVTIDTVGSQINGNISVAGNGAVKITTGTVSGGIHVDEFDGQGIGNVLITTNGAINNPSGQAIVFNNLQSFSPITGSITLTANATVTGAIDLEQARASATGPVTVTLKQGVTSNINVSNAGSGATTVSTQGIDGSLIVTSSGHLNTTVNGNINAVGVSAEAFGASITGPGDMNVALNGAVSATGTGVGATGAAGAFVGSAGISASGHTRIFNASGSMTAMATSSGAAGSATAVGAGASSIGSAKLEATFSGAISATATATGAGGTADATGVRTGTGNGGTGDLNLLLNGPVTAIASAGNGGTATAIGIQAFFQGGGSANLNVTANDMLLAKATDGAGQAIGILALDFNNVASTTAMTFIAKKDVSAVGSVSAIGIAALQGASGLGGVSFDVMGSVTATASGGAAGGILASITNAANTNALAIHVGGDVIATGQASQAGQAFGVMASSAGTGDIVIDVAGAVQSAGVGISASHTTAGNIFINADSITGTTGVITSGGTATVVIGSSVTGTDGIAVQLGGTNDILRLLGTTITGSVIGSGTSILQLGGTNSAKFDSSLGGFASVASFAGSNWSLNGSSSFAGPITVDGGLAVNGLLPNATVVVGADGTLSGNGTVGNVTMNGGTLSPGNSPGTLTMASLTMTAATTYLVQIQGPVGDKVVVTGNATIAGAVVVDPLTRQTQRTTYKRGRGLAPRHLQRAVAGEQFRAQSGAQLCRQ